MYYKNQFPLTKKVENLKHIKTIFNRLYKEPFPSDRGKEILGVDLVLIDSDTMGLTSRFLSSKGHLTVDEIKMLESCLSDLNKIVPQLDKNEKQYFTSLRQLAKDILTFSKGKILSDDKIVKQHKWKKVYNQIKTIVNELDPLGVADIVGDEYDDLNFRIYSQLLSDREDSTVRHAIKTMLYEDYGVSITDNELNETIEKLKNISLEN